MSKLKLLVLIKNFGELFPKHKHKFDMIAAVEKYAHVKYWHNDGDIFKIIKALEFKPDFIIHYDIAWKFAFAPKITGLDRIQIPKGCFVIDTHWLKSIRESYFVTNKVDLIFSATKESFHKTFPKHISKHRWLPFSINPEVIRDYKLEKSIDFLLMGLVYVNPQQYDKYRPKVNPPKCKYSFREVVLNRMEKVNGFVYIPHPGHVTPLSKNLIVNENYAKKINEAKISFTCGAVNEYPVAKFFEILGCKTLLLAKPNPDILELGFVDQENFIACNEMDFFEKAMYYLNHVQEREEITNRGYDFIHSNHTNDVRAQQFIAAIKKFLLERQ